MADWQDVGKNNFSDAQFLLENKRYRSATSRFYYAAFAALTFELIRRGASVDFSNNKATPSHAQLLGLTQKWFIHMSEERRENLAEHISRLYRSRITSDYELNRIDRLFARAAFRDAVAIFTYLEIKQ